MFLGEKTDGNLLEFCLKIVFLSFGERFDDDSGKPPEQGGIRFRERIQDTVHTFRNQRGGVQFDLIVGKLAEFPCKGLQGMLEEAVDGADRERTVVVEYVTQHLRCPDAQFFNGSGLRKQVLKIRGGHGVLRKDMEFLEYPGLHLVSRLVGEGDCKNMPVRVPVLFPQDKSEICLGKVVGLSRPCRCFHYPYHLPQIILKSQFLQISVSSVRFHSPVSREEISRRSCLTPSSASRRNSPLRGTSFTGSTARVTGE